MIKKNKVITANFVQPILTVYSSSPIRKVLSPEEAHGNDILIMNVTLQANEIDDWLFSQKPEEEKNFSKHLHFDNPLQIRINGQQNDGVILKPCL
ncbi:MAG: hypothetical protein CO128_03975 [Ignavibacteriales bacterium CG_4_9_14_3_um_filter_30_11]|nr:MAG: hypothetical protein CO128_03975 [Ignavibacteriales bacterium CG_4_9_14_3_um_filter_30_11]